MTFNVFSASGRLFLLPHLALAWRLDLMFNQWLAGWRSPLWVMEAEWWWLQTAAHHFCSSVGPLLSDGAVIPCWRFKKETKVTDCYRYAADPQCFWRPLVFYSHLGDVLFQSCVCAQVSICKSQSQDRRECFPPILFFQERSRKDLSL